MSQEIIEVKLMSIEKVLNSVLNLDLTSVNISIQLSNIDCILYITKIEQYQLSLLISNNSYHFFSIDVAVFLKSAQNIQFKQLFSFKK